MSEYDLEGNEVKAYSDPTFPDWKLWAAEYGQEWALTKMGARYPSEPRERIRWFRGAPTRRYRGVFQTTDPGAIWLSADMRSREEIIEVAAHETVHSLGYELEEVPRLVGKMCARHWSGERTVYVHHGWLRLNWMPEGVEELPSNAIVLELDDGAATNHNRGTSRRPSWARVHLAD